VFLWINNKFCIKEEIKEGSEASEKVCQIRERNEAKRE
jgi:hypothetical protein